MTEEKPKSKFKQTMIEKITEYDKFGFGANFTFSGERVFKTLTGACCTFYAILFFLLFLYSFYTAPFIPFDTDITFNSVKKKVELLDEKLNFDSHLLYWFYINAEVTDANSVPFEYINGTEFRKFIHVERCVFRKWEFDATRNKKVFRRYRCDFEAAKPEIEKLYRNVSRRKAAKGDFGIEWPVYLTVKELVGDEDELEVSDFASLTFRPCKKSDFAGCHEERLKKFRMFVMHKPMNANEDKRVVMAYYADMVRRGIDIYEGNPLNFTVRDDFDPIVIAQEGEISNTYVFGNSEINYYEIFPLRRHNQNMKIFLNGSEIALLGKSDNFVGTHGATLIYRWNNEKPQVWLLTKFKVSTKEIAGMMSLIGLVIMIIYGSYNTKILDNNIMNSLARDTSGRKIAEFSNPRIVMFYLRNPGYSIKFYLDYSNPDADRNKLAKVKEKLRRLLLEEKRMQVFIKAAIEVLYKEELELSRIFIDDCRLQAFKESIFDKETERLLRAAYIGKGLRILKAVDKNPTVKDKHVSLYGFTGEKYRAGRDKRIARVAMSGIDDYDDDWEQGKVTVGFEDSGITDSFL